jgi:hypothetical protein
LTFSKVSKILVSIIELSNGIFAIILDTFISNIKIVPIQIIVSPTQIATFIFKNFSQKSLNLLIITQNHFDSSNFFSNSSIYFNHSAVIFASRKLE